MATKKRVEKKFQKSKKESKSALKIERSKKISKTSSVKKATKTTKILIKKSVKPKTKQKKAQRSFGSLRTKRLNRTNASEMFKKIDWSQSYISLILGIIVVVVLAILIFSFFNAKNSFFTKTPAPTLFPSTQNIDKTKIKTQKAANSTGKIYGTTYTVEQGDSLVDIAQRAYGNPDRWVDIANVNNLTEPDILNAGQVIKIPR